MKKAVSAQFLLQGAYYAANQCGLLLRDAVSLYKRKSYSSAIVLAAFAREELGRSRILLNFRKQVVETGKIVTTEDIQRECRDHVTKQEWAYLSTMMKASDDEELGKLISARMRLHPQSKAYAKVDNKLQEIYKRLRKKLPQDRHESRVRALYVEPDQLGTGWNRPWEATQEEAEFFLTHASNDYSTGVHQRLQSKVIDPELARALEEWEKRPDIPVPEWP